ncbi:MAG: deoxyhypusine synthase family protein [Planctomycetota bacterium]|nr:deoxyhypusine synthase family protein [Planctomycetota bacterium]MDG1984323.1 deoxyhypusine synthase family protein [Planctomycetota bacterium]
MTEVRHLDHLIENAFPSFGGGYIRRVWGLLDRAIGEGVPMTLAVAGPVTASGQHIAWLNPLLDTGWFCLVSTTDAVCYHDGHRGLNDAALHPIHEVPLNGDDGALREDRIIRITDVGFDEDVLLGQDRFLSALLREPEFQKKMTGTELRYLLGSRFARQEKKNDAPEGLLALCHRKAIPVFVGAPADGSVFLNSMKLWAMAEAGMLEHAFELDLHAEVFESCAYHVWGQRESRAKALGTLVLGGGVPKNFNLQPEPALSQILGLEDVEGFLYDIQITTAPVTDGSLSSCPPAEAVTWGKVDKDAYLQTTESMQADYSTVMPFITKALLDKRDRLRRLRDELGEATLLERHPEAPGYLRGDRGFRLYDERERLVDALKAEVAGRSEVLTASIDYDLA